MNLENASFWGLCKLVIASTDPKNTFENACKWSLACVDLSEGSFGAIQEGVSACHGRHVVLHAHVPLVCGVFLRDGFLFKGGFNAMILTWKNPEFGLQR